MNSTEFAQQFLLDEVDKMNECGVKLHLIAAMVHGIESAGALLDQLPFKAKGQGKKRFDLALRKLFPANYTEAGRHVNLYSQLRSHMAHSMLPAKSIHVHLQASDTHLNYSDEVLNISLTSFYNDYRCAILSLIQLLESGKLKNKKIVFENLNGLTE